MCKNPTEEKYRKIKLSNKVYQVCLHFYCIPFSLHIQEDSCAFFFYHSALFQEKVCCAEGGREFLQSLGFASIVCPVEGQGKSVLMPFDKQVPYHQAT